MQFELNDLEVLYREVGDIADCVRSRQDANLRALGKKGALGRKSRNFGGNIESYRIR